LQEDGGSNWAQVEHCCPFFGWSWYLEISCETFAWANTLSGIAVAEMMAPAIIGMLFNSDRRQTPSFVDSA
jgi:hypothetical protein